MTFVSTELELPFWSHVEELRRTFLAILLVIAIGFTACLVGYRPLYSLLTYPLKQVEGDTQVSVETLTTKRLINRSKRPQQQWIAGQSVTLEPGEEKTITVSESPSLALLSPIDGMTTTLRVCFWSSVALTAPFWMLLILRFVSPALNARDRTLIPRFLLIASFALVVAIFLGLTLLLPLANRYLYSFNLGIGNNIWTLSHYLNYTVLLLTGSVLASETAATLIFLVYLNKLSATTLIRYRRIAIVLFFFGSAVLTPPDIISQITLALPLTGLYELAILYAKWKQGSSC